MTFTTATPALPSPPTTLTVTEARRTRRTDLEQIVARGAACADDTMEFHRVDNEPLTVWKLRREYLICAFCTPCSVRAACEETALRAGEGEESGDTMVRGGHYSEDLYESRMRQQARLRRAVAADEACTR